MTGATAPVSSTDAEPARVIGHLLLVEDNPVNLMVAQRLIGLLGLHCEVAENGQQAIERLRAGQIDLVLMDCQMPVKDGYTATREWREHEQSAGLARLPIIAMTANAMAGDRQKCLDAGMDDYLTKPVDRRVLESMIRQHLSAPRTPAVPVPAPRPEVRPAAPAPMPPAVPVVPAPVLPAPPIPRAAVAAPPAATPSAAAPAAATGPAVLDHEIIEELQAVMGNEFHGLVHVFLEDAPGHVDNLEVAASNNDLPAMIAPAHTLKSAAANLGAMALSDAAKRIEAGARQGDLPRAAIAVAVLDAELRRAREALSKYSVD